MIADPFHVRCVNTAGLAFFCGRQGEITNHAFAVVFIRMNLIVRFCKHLPFVNAAAEQTDKETIGVAALAESVLEFNGIDVVAVFVLQKQSPQVKVIAAPTGLPVVIGEIQKGVELILR